MQHPGTSTTHCRSVCEAATESLEECSATEAERAKEGAQIC